MAIFLAMAALAACSGGAILKPVANMYSGRTEDTDVVSQAVYGTNVGCVEENGAWVKVRTPDDYTGWMPASFLRRGREYASRGRIAQVWSLFANLYREPDVTRHEPLLTVPFETQLEVAAGDHGPNGRWLEARLVDDRTAWIQRGDVTFDTAPLSIDAAIALGKRFLGIPYLWGGTSSFGYDCSGLMQMLCRRRGVLIPRDAGPQAHWSGMLPVDREDLQPGDLLYFGRSVEKITHTGMYIGNGQFLNATTHETPSVRIDNLNEPYWTKLLVAARRLK